MAIPLCTGEHRPPTELRLAELQLCTHSSLAPRSLLPQPAEVTNLLSVSMNVTAASTSWQGNHTACVFCDWLVSLSVRVHPYCGGCQHLFPF